MFLDPETQSLSGGANTQCRIESVFSPLWQERTIEMVSETAVAEAMHADATSRKILAKGLRAQPGDLVGVRLNLNVLKSRGMPVQTLHAGNGSGGHTRNKGFYNGSVICYERCVTLKNAFFNVDQKGRDAIASGVASKYPMASVDGEYAECNADFDGIEISFNPKRVHLFTDANARPIRWAETVTIYAHRAYARGMIEYYSPATAPRKVGYSPSSVCFG